MRNRIIGIDVDLTLVDSFTPWLKWYENKTGIKLCPNHNGYKYDMKQEMSEVEDPIEYWRIPDLYDDMKPLPHSQEVLEDLVSKGNDVIIVSHCMPEHVLSKDRWIKVHFPFVNGIVYTPQKQYVSMDVFVDDHPGNLTSVKNYNPNVECLLFSSKIDHGKHNYKPFQNWKEIQKQIK